MKKQKDVGQKKGWYEMIDRKELDGYFTAKRSESEYCQCDCCAKVAFVTIFSFPLTRHRNGNKLLAERKTIWICDECAAKLNKALQGIDK